jgi:hypothetical protein
VPHVKGLEASPFVIWEHGEDLVDLLKIGDRQ